MPDLPPDAPAPPARPGASRPRDAAALILWRTSAAGPELLMGLRHARHRFMPGVLVFPGGRVDPGDHRLPASSDLHPLTRAQLETQATPARARAIAVAAVRELAEETGLVLGEQAGGVLRPALAPLEYLCRAVTPPAFPVRFHARFLVAPAAAASGTIGGSGELERIGWYALGALAEQPVAWITRQVVTEFSGWLALDTPARAARPLFGFRRRDLRLPDRPA